MQARLKSTAKWGVLAVALLIAVAIGYTVATLGDGTIGSQGRESASVMSTGKTAGLMAPADSAPTPPDVTAESAGNAVAGSDSGVASPAPDRLVISTASMAIEVESVDDAVEAVRTMVTTAGGEITNLSIQAGEPSQPIPLEGDVRSVSPVPGSALITVRVPADQLASIEAQAAKLGAVLSQSAAESDVTQQHVDLAARLTNLRAEEARLRGFLSKATKVSEMLEVERELSRVRGEIESMQAQLEYLERQAAMATLTLSLTAPGPVVRPSGTDWGFSEAVTAGVQAAAAVVGNLIMITIALTPVLLIVALVVIVWRAVRRHHARAHIQTPQADGADSTPNDLGDNTSVSDESTDPKL